MTTRPADGPTSGSDALAGVLYLDTTPRRDRRRVSLGYGAHGSVDGDVEFASVADKRYAALSVGHVTSDGTNSAQRGAADDGYASITAHLRAGLDVAGWQVSVGGRLTEAENEYDPSPAPRYVPADGDRLTDRRLSVVHADARFTGSDRVETWLTLAGSRDRNSHYADGTFTNQTVGRRDTATAAANFHFGQQHVNLAAEVANG